MSSYEDFRPLWEAWKRNTRRPEDAEEAANWDAAREVFLAVADPGAVSPHAAALSYLREALPGWRKELLRRGLGDASSTRVALFRGLRDQSAAKARVFGQSVVSAGKPVSLTFGRDVALGFARQGVNDGYVGVVMVPLEAIVFADLDGHFTEAGGHEEKEIVVVSQVPLAVECEVERVAPGAKRLRNNTHKAQVEQEKRRLLAYEESLRSITQSSSATSRSQPHQLDERESGQATQEEAS